MRCSTSYVLLAAFLFSIDSNRGSLSISGVIIASIIWEMALFEIYTALTLFLLKQPMSLVPQSTKSAAQLCYEFLFWSTQSINPSKQTLVAGSISGLDPYSRSRSRSCQNISIKYSISALFDWFIFPTKVLQSCSYNPQISKHSFPQQFHMLLPGIDLVCSKLKVGSKQRQLQQSQGWLYNLTIILWMHSSFKTKPIPYSQVETNCRQLLDMDHDSSFIPDEHENPNNHLFVKPPCGSKNKTIHSGIKPTPHKQTSDSIKSSTKNINSKNSTNDDIKKLTHGLTSYQDIKSSYCIIRSQDNLNKSRSGSKKKKKPNLDGELFNKVNFDQVECTFTPKTNTGQSYKNFKDFVHFQDNFLAKKQEKIEKIKKQMSEKQTSQATFAPIIDKNSRKISQSVTDVQIDSHGSLKKLEKASIYERLYNIPRKKDRVDEEATFTPKILKKSKSMIRSDKVENLLYSDAQRRIQHQKMLEKQSISKYPPACFSSTRQKHNNRLVCKKIRSQFLQFVQDDQEDGIMKTVSPILAVTVISEIFNVELNPNKNQQLCWLIVSLLIGDEAQSSKAQKNGEIETRRLWDFIKFIVVGDENFQKGMSSFSQEDAKKIHRQLGSFYSMRLSKCLSKADEVEGNQGYRIETSAKTNKMAEAHRARKLEQITQFITETNIGEAEKTLLNSKTVKNMQSEAQQRVIRLEDLFILDEIRKKTELEQIRMKKQQQEMKECTFKPALNELTLRKAKGRNNSRTNITSEPLHQQKLKQVDAQKEKNKKIIIKSKNNENRPSIDGENKALKYKEQVSTCRNIKNVDKNLLRLNLARKVKDAEIANKQRGYKCSSNSNWLRQVQGQKRQILEEVSNYLGYRANSNEKQIVSQN